ncbi:MAG: DUF3455 domain-containing protein [Micromonosporaceae bacterium]|nr:DUF3455 domain-containing protein [Micromonosporaceae bacterium]
MEMRARSTWVRLGGLVVALLAIAGFVAVRATAQAAETPQAATSTTDGTPDGPTPGPMYRVYEVYHATGTQTYTCADAGTWGTSSTPDAQLVSVKDPLRRIHHFAGPRWQLLNDGSQILGHVVLSVPQPGTIAELLLSTTAEIRGYLSPVVYVSRDDPTGGVAPPGGCTPGATVAVPYTAYYVFWIAGGPTISAITH